MHKKISLLAALALTGSASANLLITGVVDGPLTGGLPKAIELFALTDIADLSTYGVESANNGGGAVGPEFMLSGSVSAGAFIYVASEAPQFEATFGFAPTFTDGAANINGDDAVVLYLNGTAIDVFGEPDVDGTGQAWEHLDSWAYRSDSNVAAAATFDSAGWSFGGVDALDGLDAAGTQAAVPFGTYSPVPEPSTYAALLGALALGFVAYRRRKA